MPRNFSRRTFDKWLEKNINLLRYRPMISISRKHYFVLQFSGLASELTATITNDGGAAIAISNSKGEYWDILADFDIQESITAEGMYYCGLCLKPTYYHSRVSLWEEHAFNAVADWNSKLSSDDWICLWGSYSKSFGAVLAKSDECQGGSGCITCFPLVVETKQAASDC